MSSSRLKHEKNYTSCHHCHLTSPIPLSELIRTHPLRSVVAKECHGEDVGRKCSHRRKENTIREECDVHSLLDEVASNEYRLRKLRSTSSSSNKSNSENSLSRESIDTAKFVKPVHSFLHHESTTSAYKEPLISSTSNNTNTIQSKQSRKSSRNLISTGTILNPRGLEIPDTHSSHSKNYSSIRNFTKPKSDYIFRNIETQTSRNNSVLNGYLYNNNNSKPLGSDVTLLSILNHKHSKRKRCDKFFCSLPSGLLFAGYGLLIVIGIVIAVALSQRERRISLKSASFPQRPVAFSGAKPAPVGERVIAIRTPPTRRRINTALRKTVRPVQRVAAEQNVHHVTAPQPTAAPQPRQQPQIPSAVGVPLQVFRDDDLDYFDGIGFNDQEFLLPKQNVQQQQPQFVQQQSVPQHPTQQAFRPVEIEPQFRPQVPVSSPAQEIRTVTRVVPRQHQQQHQQQPRQQHQQQQQQATTPRRNVPSTFQQEFNMADKQGNAPRGQKEPAVKIVKSWSNRNADGTFSWGYINTDGSFKNETKGADCVVRGVYGYVDEKTGETLTFPYASGNPCDPNEPDYYYDYEDGTINQGGKVVNQPKKSNQLVAKRRPS